MRNTSFDVNVRWGSDGSPRVYVLDGHPALIGYTDALEGKQFPEYFDLLTKEDQIAYEQGRQSFYELNPGL